MYIITLWYPNVPSWNVQSNFIYIFYMVVVLKWLLYMKYIVKKLKSVFCDLCPSLFAQAILHTSALSICSAKQFRVFLYSLKINDLTSHTWISYLVFLLIRNPELISTGSVFCSSVVYTHTAEDYLIYRGSTKFSTIQSHSQALEVL
jgi:hypothetical protein